MTGIEPVTSVTLESEQEGHQGIEPNIVYLQKSLCITLQPIWVQA